MRRINWSFTYFNLLTEVDISRPVLSRPLSYATLRGHAPLLLNLPMDDAASLWHLAMVSQHAPASVARPVSH